MALRDRNHPSVVEYILANERDIFDLLRKNIMIDMHGIDDTKLIETYFKQNNLSQTGSKNKLSPVDISIQARRGLMYIDGRLDQIIMSNNSEDGFAINGWSRGSSGIPMEQGELINW